MHRALGPGELTLVRLLKVKFHQILTPARKFTLECKFFTFHRLCPHSGRDSCLLRAVGEGFSQGLWFQGGWEQGELPSREEVARLACPRARLKSSSSAPNEVPPPAEKQQKINLTLRVEVRNPSFLGRIQSRFPSPTCAQVPSRASSATQELWRSFVQGGFPSPCALTVLRTGLSWWGPGHRAVPVAVTVERQRWSSGMEKKNIQVGLGPPPPKT